MNLPSFVNICKIFYDIVLIRAFTGQLTRHLRSVIGNLSLNVFIFPINSQTKSIVALLLFFKKLNLFFFLKFCCLRLIGKRTSCHSIRSVIILVLTNRMNTDRNGLHSVSPSVRQSVIPLIRHSISPSVSPSVRLSSY